MKKPFPTQESQRLTIPNFIGEFCPFLHERLHNVIDHFLQLNGQFTLIVNILDRTNEETLHSKRLIYAGVYRQKELLEKNFRQKATDKALKAFDQLSKYDFEAESGLESSTLYLEFINGELDMSDVQEGDLALYFGEYPETQEFKNEGQGYEYPILDQFFDIATDNYISLPLIQFGNFEGVVHVIYKSGLTTKIATEEGKRQLIRFLCFEYEAILLDNDSFGGNIYKESLLQEELKNLTNDEYYEKFNKNKILKELHLKEYYQANLSYFSERLKQTNAIPAELLKQHRKNAIMSILIDSYAHNMSAHSLTALEWWFRLRAQKLYDEEFSDGAIAETIKDKYPILPVITSDQPLAGEIHPLLRFLLDKGAFWTGLTRKGSFGGKISSLYSVLWYDFIRNPLYLGTIAFSEGILKLNINLTIYESEEIIENGIKRKKVIKKTADGRWMDGRFVQINLSQFYDINIEQIAHKKEESRFVEKSDLFYEFKRELKKHRVFFPGGVVGRHSFFTILENEIRNVKHFDKKHLKKMREEGLTLNLSIEETSSSKETDISPENKSELYKIGVWLKHPASLNKELVTKKLRRLEGDIIDENYVTRLGGSFQDKVCSAMLMNNDFMGVQNQETARDKKFYPWMKTGSSALIPGEEGIVEDYELSLSQYNPEHYRRLHLIGKDFDEARYQRFQDSRATFEKNYQAHEGYIKKFFYLWKGENFYDFNASKSFDKNWENMSRFRFIRLDKKDKKLSVILNSGVIRLIEHKTTDPVEVYRTWLSNWLKTSDGYQIKFRVRNQNAARLVYDGEKIVYYNRDEFANWTDEQLERYDALNGQQTINLIHSTREDIADYENICKYRNHGVFIEYFCQRKQPHDATILEKDGLAAELLETLATNICIFDNRIANRVQKTNTETLKSALNCAIFEENVSDWEKEQAAGLDRYHFLVIHLSFIEAFKDQKGQKKYSEKEIDEFIKQEILHGRKKMKDNFKLVVTTGRGRTQWWTKLEEMDEGYTAFTTFRPVESLIASIENSVSMQDDIELKYRLVKVLFGS